MSTDGPATLAQLAEIGERLIDLHGQHAHQSLGRPEAQRELLDAFGGVESLARERRGGVAHLARCRGAPRPWRPRGRHATKPNATHCRRVTPSLPRWAPATDEWQTLSHAQSRLAHAATLLEAATTAEAELTEGDAALGARLAALAHRLAQAAQHDLCARRHRPAADEAKIRVEEAGRSLRAYRERLDLDPAELARVETRLAAFHDLARKHRVRPEALPALAEETGRRLAELAAGADADALAREAAQARQSFDALAQQLSVKRKAAAAALGKRVNAMMKELAMAGGRCEITLTPLSEPASFGAGARRISRRHPSEAGAGAAGASRVGRRVVAACAWRSRSCWPKSVASRR